MQAGKQGAQAPVQQADPLIEIGKLPLSLVNFILSTLNANPLGAPVMEVARAIQLIEGRAGPQVKAIGVAEEAAAPVAPPRPNTRRGKR